MYPEINMFVIHWESILSLLRWFKGFQSEIGLTFLLFMGWTGFARWFAENGSGWNRSTCGLVDSLMKVTCCPLIWATLLEWRLQFVQFTCFHAFWHEIHQDWIDQWKYQKSSTWDLWWWFEALNLECVANIHPIIQPGGWLVSAERQEPQFFISILTDVEGED